MIRNISKKIKSLLILSLCCSITFQNTLLIGNAEETNINVENEMSNTPEDSQVEEEITEVTNNSEEELDDSTIIEDKYESIEEQNEIIEEYLGVPNMGLDVTKVSSVPDVKVVSLNNPNAIGSGYVINAQTLNVRSGPSTSYDKIGTLSANETVEILGTSGSWYKIDFKGKEGYVSAAYLALNAIEKGIDVSKYNGNIDWQSVKKAGVSYAIIRLGYDGKDGINGIDPKFHTNIQGAIDAGMKVGVYWFSYATTVQGAEKEAEKCLETLAPYKGKLTYPVFFDYEYDSVAYATKQGITVTKDLATNMAKAFLNKIKSNGYLTGLYTNTDFSSRYFHNELLYSNNIWHAQYNSVNTFSKPYSMWQYSDKGSVSGISGSVDLNYTTLKTFDIDYTPNAYEIGITTTNLNLTIGPFTNATVVSTVNKGASVEILDKGISGWYYVQYNGQRGYLPSQYISITEKGTTSTNLNLTVGPFTNATVVSTVNKGASVKILDKGISGWYYVQYNGKRGYLPSQCVPINGSTSEIGITIANIDLTIGPFTNATILSTIKAGSAVEILDKGISGWYYIQYNGKRGYLPTKYVSQWEVGTTTNNVDLYVGPFTYATIITTISKDSTIEILDRSISDWYYIQYEGLRGYVPAKYIK